MRAAAALLAALLLAGCCARPAELERAVLYASIPDDQGLWEVDPADFGGGALLDPNLLVGVLARARVADWPVLLKGRGHLIVAHTRAGRELRMEACLYGAWHRRLVYLEGCGWLEVAEADAQAWIAETDRAAGRENDG